ncbi:MAG TPA: NUDIX domain-containing protein [Ktedonobacteraceae bacterium]
MGLRSHYVATGYIYDSTKSCFLLIKHKKLGQWLAPGGHLTEDEEPHAGALREVWEEIGQQGKISDLLITPEVATATVPQLPAPFCMLAETIPAGPREGEHIHIDFVYVVEIDPTAKLSLSDEEITNARWFTLDEINQLETYENVKRVCWAISNSSRQSRLNTL